MSTNMKKIKFFLLYLTLVTSCIIGPFLRCHFGTVSTRVRKGNGDRNQTEEEDQMQQNWSNFVCMRNRKLSRYCKYKTFSFITIRGGKKKVIFLICRTEKVVFVSKMMRNRLFLKEYLLPAQTSRLVGCMYLYINKVVISVCLFLCSTITHVASNFDWGTRENHGNVLSLVLRF